MLQREHQGERLGRGNEFATVAMHVFLADQSFDDGRAGGRRAQALLIHRGAQLFVFDEFAGAFHGRQQGSLTVARRRLGLVGARLDRIGRDRFAGRYGRQGLILGGQVAAVNGQPAGIDQHLAVGAELLAFHRGNAGGLQELSRRMKHGQKTLDHKIVEFLFGIRQRLGRLQGRNDGEVVGDLAVVENPLVGFNPTVLEHILGVHHVGIAVGKHFHRLLDRADVVLRQGPRVGTRIGEHLVLFIQGLGDRQGVAGREPEATVGFALQAGQVEKQGGTLGGRLGFLAHDARPALAARHDLLCAPYLPEAFCARLFVVVGSFEVLGEPAAVVSTRLGAKGGVHLPIVTRRKGAYFLLALDHDRQGRGLDPSHGREIETALLRIEGGHGARAVDADQPIGLGAATRGIGQRQHFLVRPQLRKTLANRAWRHRL